MQGWISLHRQIIENEFYFAERFTKMQAWIDLLLLANHKPVTIFIRGNEINLKAGQLAYSQLSLAKRWKWNRKTVDKFLSMLQNREMLDNRKTRLTTIISIRKWNDYQQSGQQNGQQRDNRTDIDNNANNVFNDNNSREKHGHDLSLSKKTDSKPKHKPQNWRHRKRNENEEVFVTREGIQKYFSRAINQRDLNEINNIAEKYGIGTMFELFTRLSDKIYSTNIWTNEIIEATSKELIYRDKIYQDEKNKITKADLKKGKIDQQIIETAKDIMKSEKKIPMDNLSKTKKVSKPTKLNLIQDVYKEDFNDKEYSQKNAVC